jgi:ParB-like chromosome segregation protein Spo0J
MKTDWEDKKEKIKNLNLDLQNPRVPKHIKDNKDVNSIRNYLIEKTDVLKIAESIAVNGYHRSAIAIVCNEHGKLVVLDGNRRLAACQLLLEG